ncbi:MAG: LytTR family transcriptional regulator DNA-binding domain-containing protein [Bacteroidetes bacterium]|nr:LytTR family transcriptional regulator DNA-binding domain-containing protein [Bacteroidota bacterium]
MENLSILIVEDNTLIAYDIKEKVENMGHHVVGTAATADAAIRLHHENSIDLAILDINLKGDKDGVEVAKVLDAEDIPFIYLTSYYDQATLDKVKKTRFAAFITKPYSEIDLKLNIELAYYKRKLVDLDSPERKKDFVVYHENKMNKKIHFDDIYYVKADDNYSVFYTDKRKILVRIPLKNLDDELKDARFFRTHRSYIVNMDKIQSFSNNAVIVTTGDQLPISNSRRKEFKTHLKAYWH